jgi:hypothetical protein
MYSQFTFLQYRFFYRPSSNCEITHLKEEKIELYCVSKLYITYNYENYNKDHRRDYFAQASG